MRRVLFGVLVAAVPGVCVGGCGGGAQFANGARPAVPINLAVYIDDARVLVSPSSVGAGPVSFIVTNQASRTESLKIARSGSGAALANTGPINPQATAQVTVNFRVPGRYTISVGTGGGRTEAQRAFPPPSTTRSAALQIGRRRANSSGTLLQP